MSYENYSQEEINNIITELLETYRSHLIPVEVHWLKTIELDNTIGQSQRDILIAMYDRIRDNP